MSHLTRIVRDFLPRAHPGPRPPSSKRFKLGRRGRAGRAAWARPRSSGSSCWRQPERPRGGGLAGSPRWRRMRCATDSSSIMAIMRMAPPQRGQTMTSIENVRARSRAQSSRRARSGSSGRSGKADATARFELPAGGTSRVGGSVGGREPGDSHAGSGTAAGEPQAAPVQCRAPGRSASSARPSRKPRPVSAKRPRACAAKMPA